MLVHDRKRPCWLLGLIAAEFASHELYRIEESSTEFQLKRTNHPFFNSTFQIRTRPSQPALTMVLRSRD